MEIAYIIIPVEDNSTTDERESEITALVKSAGADPVGKKIVKINRIVPSTYIGSGNVELIKNNCIELGCNLVVFDGDLSPSQTLNLSAAIDDIKVIDRTTLILDIFAARATTSEGKIQVELAQLNYLYPRLKGKGIGLSRLGGGIGTRGPGESMLETDRRHIRRRINYLDDRLNELEKRRELQSERRSKNGALKVALVGYTNTGKSTLLNALTGSDVLTEDKLFATLDPITRKLGLGAFTVLLQDTVGFIKDIPTTLIEAFKSTLETAVNADLVLIVCYARTDWQAQLETTASMLDELKVNSTRLLVFNKCEDITEFSAFPAEAQFISAKYGLGLDGLKAAISSFFDDMYEKHTFTVGYEEYRKLSDLRKYAEFWHDDYIDTGVFVTAVIAKKNLQKFNAFI